MVIKGIDGLKSAVRPFGLNQPLITVTQCDVKKRSSRGRPHFNNVAGICDVQRARLWNLVEKRSPHSLIEPGPTGRTGPIHRKLRSLSAIGLEADHGQRCASLGAAPFDVERRAALRANSVASSSNTLRNASARSRASRSNSMPLSRRPIATSDRVLERVPWHAARASEPLILNARVQPPLTNLSDLQSCVNVMSSNLFSKITLFILMPSRGGAFERTADTLHRARITRGCSYVTSLATSLDCEADRRIRQCGRCYLHLDDPQETKTVWIAFQQLHLGVLGNGLATVRGRFRRTGSKRTGSKDRGECVAIHTKGLTGCDAKMINSGASCRGIRRRG